MAGPKPACGSTHPEAGRLCAPEPDNGVWGPRLLDQDATASDGRRLRLCQHRRVRHAAAASVAREAQAGQRTKIALRDHETVFKCNCKQWNPKTSKDPEKGVGGEQPQVHGHGCLSRPADGSLKPRAGPAAKRRGAQRIRHVDDRNSKFCSCVRDLLYVGLR